MEDESRRLRRLRREVEERDGDYLRVYQAHEGEYKEKPCVRVSYLYNSCPEILIRIGNLLQSIERDGTPFEVFKPRDNDTRQLEDLKNISRQTLEELLKKRKYQELRDRVKGEFEDGRTYVVFVNMTSLTGWQTRKTRRLLSKFRKKIDRLCVRQFGGDVL